MSATRLPADHDADRLFATLAAGTLRSRTRFMAQCAQAPWATAWAETPASPQPLEATSCADSRPGPDPAARLFDILAAPSLRRRERYLAQCAQAPWADTTTAVGVDEATPGPAASGEVSVRLAAPDPVARLFEILAAPGLRRRARFIAQSPTLA